ncbi:MAG TPA: ABC transporter ATP-binding protein [Ktedonobacterales bacterium]|jgi:putative ABC transport system ATP-binding protein|nr:ABC transporter ATP-binding protein [Ktedonobacterales bacterium]
MNDASELISLADITKVYRGAGQTALSGVSLAIPTGQFAAVMGPSGSGKSTLLNMIAGLDRPTQGEVQVDGVNVNRLSEAALARYRRAKLGFVFQFFNLLDRLTVLDNILLPAQLVGLKPRVAQERAHTLLTQLGIAEKARAYPSRLSGGERQRVAIARALINQPAVLLADEPTGALDSRSGEAVMEMLAQIHQGGQTVLLVTHDAKLAASYASRVLTMRDGRIVDDAQLAPPAPQAASDLLRLRNEEAM